MRQYKSSLPLPSPNPYVSFPLMVGAYNKYEGMVGYGCPAVPNKSRIKRASAKLHPCLKIGLLPNKNNLSTHTSFQNTSFLHNAHHLPTIPNLSRNDGGHSIKVPPIKNPVKRKCPICKKDFFVKKGSHQWICRDLNCRIEAYLQNLREGRYYDE